MKSFLLYLFTMSLFLFSCNSNSVNPIDVPIVSSVSQIDGKIDGWENGRIGKVYFLTPFYPQDTISTASIDGEGNFKLTDLKEINPDYLINHAYPQYVDDLDYLDNHVVCSDSSAGMVSSYLFAYADSDENYWGHLLLKNFSYSAAWDLNKLSKGDTYVEFFYVDKDVELYGDVEAHYRNHPFDRGQIINHYDLKYKKGWNACVTKIISHEYFFIGDTSYIVAEYNISNSYSSGFFWDKY